MDPAKRPLSLWKVLGRIAVGTGVFAVALVVWLEWVTARERGRVEARLEELAREAAARNPARPNFRDTPLPGNAWDDYLQALLGLERQGLTRHSFYRFLERPEDADPASVAATVRACQPILELLRRGTTRNRAQYPHDWTHPAPIVTRRPAIELLTDLVRSHARLLSAEGRAVEAAEWSLDLALFVRDLGHNGFDGRLADYLLLKTLAELRTLIVTRPFPLQALPEMDRRLGILDAALPREAPLVLNGLLMQGTRLLEGGFVGDYHGFRFSQLHRPKYFFSRRLQEAYSFGSINGILTPTLSAESRPHSELRAIWTKVHRDVDASEFPAAQCMIWKIQENRLNTRKHRAHLRMLQAAVRVIGGAEEIEDLADPYTEGPLQFFREVDRVRIWSAGPDGQSNFGVHGGWQGAPVPGLPAHVLDVVLEFDIPTEGK